jgi:hypothetical protein
VPLSPPIASLQAWLPFRQNAAVAQGRLPHEGPKCHVLRLRAPAAVANVLVGRNARHADELVALASRP